MKRRYIALSTIATIGMTAAMAAPAHAAQDSGSISCGSNRHIDVESTASGTVRHYAPSGTLRATYNQAQLGYRKTHTTAQNATWRVTATIAIVNAGALCDNIAP